jgi:hypothetical protein
MKFVFFFNFVFNGSMLPGISAGKGCNTEVVCLNLGQSRMPVAHTCNLSYSGGRDQEDQGSKPDQANSSLRCYLEKIHHKKRSW